MSLFLDSPENPAVLPYQGKPIIEYATPEDSLYAAAFEDEEDAASEEDGVNYSGKSFDDLNFEQIGAIDILETNPELGAPSIIAGEYEAIERSQENQFFNLFALKHFDTTYAGLDETQKAQIRAALESALEDKKIDEAELKDLQALTTKQVINPSIETEKKNNILDFISFTIQTFRNTIKGFLGNIDRNSRLFGNDFKYW